MNEQLKKMYSENNDIWGLPQEYKGLKIYPIKLIESKYMELFYRIFSYPKNYIPDKQVLKMSYLKFILYVVQPAIEKGDDYIENSIIEFFKYIIKAKQVLLEWNSKDNPKTLDEIVLNVVIDDVVLSEYDFENIREIVLEQNGLSIDYVEQYRPDMEEKLGVFNKKDDITLKDEIFGFCVLMNKSIDDIKEYTIYQFKSQLERVAILKEFELYKPLEASGQIKLQQGSEIKHYLSHVKRAGRYDSILVDKKSYQESGDVFKI
jgi:hypothetical protein